MIEETSLFDSSSQIPSLAISKKSNSGLMRNDLMSGIAVITLGLPPFDCFFAGRSPKVLLTDNRPGRTR